MGVFVSGGRGAGRLKKAQTAMENGKNEDIDDK